MQDRYKLFIDVESTGFDPMRNCVISLGAVIKDYDTGETHEFYEECRPDSLTPNYEHPSLKGFIVETWSPDAERVHGFTFKKQSGKQTGFDLAVKFLKWINQFYDGAKIPFIYHANANFDWKFVKTMMYKLDDRLYYSFLRRFSFEKTCDTMAMARTYISSNKSQLKLIKDNADKINKPRKRAASPKHLANWNDQISNAHEMLEGKVLFDGYSLDKLCRGLNIRLDHHNALSDAKALPTIYDFFQREAA